MPTQKMQPPTNGSVPNPDPTERTVEQLLREIATAREIVEANNRATREVLETRLAGMDKAIELLQVFTNKLPSQIKGEVGQLQQLHEEKFDSVEKRTEIQFEGIATQFTERDTRSDQIVKDSSKAIDAAFAAADKAVAKTETAFAKQIDEQGKRVDEMKDRFAGDLGDVKQRLQAVESRKQGSGEVISYVIGAAAVVFAIFVYVSNNNKPQPSSGAPQVVYLPSPGAAGAPPVISAPATVVPPPR